MWPIPTQVSHAMTRSTVSLTAICRFVFLPPQGTLGHSWQEAQIGFKAELSRLKKMSHPTQNRWNFVFCSFASSFLCRYAQPFPSFSIPLLFCCKASKSPSGRSQASQYRLAPLWGHIKPWRQCGRLGEVIIYLSILNDAP